MEPSSEAKRFKLLKAQISNGASFVTEWTRPGPNTRREVVYLEPYGHPAQLEPTFANPFGYIPRPPSTTDVSQVQDLVNRTGLKRRVEGDSSLSLISPEKKIKIRRGGGGLVISKRKKGERAWFRRAQEIQGPKG